ncbi:hypothetical protein WJ968_12260 [Achromobacter xylosoxidans]
MQPDTQRIAAAIDALEPYMVRTLSDFVAAQSPSGAEQPAARYIEQAWRELGLAPERILLDDAALKALPLYACPCGPDDERYNLLARHVPAAPGCARCCSTAISTWCPPAPPPCGRARPTSRRWWTAGCTAVAAAT